MTYIHWDCDVDDIEETCEYCIEDYETKRVKNHRKKIKDDLSNAREILGCPCEEIIVICCNCDKQNCDRRIAGDPEGTNRNKTIRDKVLAIEPDDFNAWVERGISHSEIGQYSESVASFEKALIINPDHIKATRNLGLAYMHLGMYDEAEATFKKIIERDPENILAHWSLADTYLLLQKLEDAEKQLRKTIKIEPDNASLYADLGHVLERLKKNDDSLKVFLKALELEPDVHLNYYNVGDAYLGLGNAKKSIQYLEKASQMAPHESLYHYDLGLAFFRLQKYDECTESFEAALRNDPDMRFGRTNLGLSATQNLGLAYLNQGMHGEAEQCFRKNILLTVSTYFNLGLTLFRQKKFSESLQVFLHTVYLAPNNAEYWDLVGNAYMGLNQYDAARKALEKSIEIDPTYALSYYDFGVMLLETKGPENEAIKFFKRAISLGEDSHHPHYALACLYSLKNKRKTALDYLRKAIQRGYEDREHIDHDPDFDTLRDDEEFQKIIKKIVPRNLMKNSNIDQKDIPDPTAGHSTLDPDNKIRPLKNCPRCGAPVILDLLYHGPGADGFKETCTKCTWSRVIEFTPEGGTTKESE